MTGVVAIGSILTLVACGASGGSADDEPYKIGFLVGLTGPYASLGEPEQQAAKLYVSRLNKAGGIDGRDVELVIADTKSSESEAINQFRRLVNQDKVMMIVGPSSTGESLALKRIATSMKVPMLSLASSTAIVEPINESRYVFKAFPDTATSLRAQLQFVQSKGLKRVAVIGANNAYGQEPLETVKSLAGEFDVEIVATTLFPPESTNMTSQLSKLESSDPEATLVWAVNPANAVIAKNAAAIDYPGIVLHSPGGASQEYISLAGKAAEGTYAQGSKIGVPEDVAKDDPQFDAIREFVSAWKNKNKTTSPNQFAGIGWDAMSLVSTALAEGDVDPDPGKGRQQLLDSFEENIKNVPLTNVVFDFDEKTHGPQDIAGLAILRVKDGKFVLE